MTPLALDLFGAGAVASAVEGITKALAWLAGLTEVLTFFTDYPGIWFCLFSLLCFGLIWWANSRTEGALSKFKALSISGIFGQAIVLIVFSVGVLDLWGVMPLKERQPRPAFKQGQQQTVPTPGQPSGSNPTSPSKVPQGPSAN